MCFVIQFAIITILKKSRSTTNFLLIIWAVYIISATNNTSAEKYTNRQALAKVHHYGIFVSSSGNCSDRHNPRCTSLEGVNSNSIDTGSGGVTTLRTASNCAITITGGTEVGHKMGTYSHWNGFKLDIRANACLDNYVLTKFKFIGVRSEDLAPEYESRYGNIYAREGNHWDIVFK